MRRGAPVATLAVVLAVILGAYILYSQRVVSQLRHDASTLGRMYARVFAGIGDPSPEAANTALLDLAAHIRELGVPVIVTDGAGRPAAWANLPFEPTGTDDRRLFAYLAQLAATNPPVVEGVVGRVYYGDSQLITSLRVIPVLLASLLLTVLAAGLYVLRTRSHAERERMWAGMARESAHQLATPLSSLEGWIELLRERATDRISETAVDHMGTDLERLERVAHRFERIGRPPRRDPVDVGALVQRVAAYFRARVPTLAHRVEVSARLGPGPLVVEGDEVLLEWAVEALAKNAIDALAAQEGGHLELSVERVDGEVRIRVADDGPGVPRELRHRIFEAGFSTKKSGWGIGLSLARRIVRESHRGRLMLVPSARGAVFDVILRG